MVSWTVTEHGGVPENGKMRRLKEIFHAGIACIAHSNPGRCTLHTTHYTLHTTLKISMVRLRTILEQPLYCNQ